MQAVSKTDSPGKNMRQEPVFEPSPIITDLPPLPFTTSSLESSLQSKRNDKQKTNAKQKVMVNHAHKPEQIQHDDGRHCDFCKKVDNICVLMHCTACHRMYHAQCLVHTFKPYVEKNVPIDKQMERLQLETPGRRGVIFRCASCKAAFMDFYESGGYLWDCQCPTCVQPEKLLQFRRRKLVKILGEMELGWQRKKVKTEAIDAGQLPVVMPSGSQELKNGATATDTETIKKTGSAVFQELTGEGSKEIKAEPMEVDDGFTHRAMMSQQQGVVVHKPQNSELTRQIEKLSTQVQLQLKLESQRMPLNDGASQVLANQPQQLKLESLSSVPGSGDPVEQPNQKDPAQKIKSEPVDKSKQSELRGDDLIAAVRVHGESNGRWCFPVMCSRSASRRDPGVMKTGTYLWQYKNHGVIRCECCDKAFCCAWFVHHTDSSLIKDPKSPEEDAMPFLFVQHYDGERYTPLKSFLPAWKAYFTRHEANNIAMKTQTGYMVKQEKSTAALSTAKTTTNPEAAADSLQLALARLQVLALFKRPKNRYGKFTSPVHSCDPSTMEFLAAVVCLSPKYVMNMVNGEPVDIVARSNYPGGNASFPRKAGWLGFSRTPRLSRTISCTCCNKVLYFDEFVQHAGISFDKRTKRPRQFLYVVEREDQSALVPFSIFVPLMELVAACNELNSILKELQPL